MKRVDDKLSRLDALIASDAQAIGFQSLGQYRAWLLRELRQARKDLAELSCECNPAPSSCGIGPRASEAAARVVR